MITAFVEIRVVPGKTSEVAQQLLEFGEVKEVYSVTGDHDLIAILRVGEHDHLSEVVPEQIAGLAGVTATRTSIAFKCYSREDLAAMWQIGLE
jgi:DNA-binding Lrp family transcriptional regulator